ncbi:MAG TPA: hypothetical protein HA328_06715 [Candidatus Poseidoniaceae archaeon]|nr:hypothetical protein [Euryarchaeota archaeon]HII58628.1 hypothetical protein [Candidatus Poseidoniaceae archaeon]
MGQNLNISQSLATNRHFLRDGNFKPAVQVADSMKAYRVSGIAPFGSVRNKFSLDLPADSKADAEHMAYSIIGSRHKAKRRVIDIESVDEIDPRTSTEPKILHVFREQIAAAGGPIAPAAEEE